MDDGTPDDDPFLWLEDVTGEQALAWVREHNDEALAELAASDRYAEIKAQVLDALDAEDRIPYVVRRGEFLYNFWRDAAHPKGLWRRTTLDEYRRPEPDWQVLVDVDALAAAEDENWVWQGAGVLHPSFDKALVQLSRGGADATVVREFDLTDAGVRRRRVHPARGQVRRRRGSTSTRSSWAPTSAPGSLTTSGYPRVVKRWSRGTPLDDAVTVFEGKPDDVAAYAGHDSDPGLRARLRGPGARLLHRARRSCCGPADELTKVDVPADATTERRTGSGCSCGSARRGWPEVGDGTEYPARRPAGRRVRRLPGRRPALTAAVHPRRAHVAVVQDLDQEPPDPRPRCGT